MTGGSRGLGYLVARELVKEGCRVVICARNTAELERARQRLSANGGEVLALTCDVVNQHDVERLITETIKHFGQLDILVNNAGIIQVAPFAATRLSDFDEAMKVIFWGTVHTTLAALPHMRARGGGRIVNIASIGGKVAVPHLLPYDCAKFAVVGFSEGLRTEVAPEEISVTTVIPGLMRTGSYDYAQFKGEAHEEYLWFSTAARMPGLAMNAERAARRVVQAAKLRDPEVVLGLPAKLLRTIKDVFPRSTLRALTVTNRLLPSPPDAAS